MSFVSKKVLQENYAVKCAEVDLGTSLNNFLFFIRAIDQVRKHRIVKEAGN